MCGAHQDVICTYTCICAQWSSLSWIKCSIVEVGLCWPKCKCSAELLLMFYSCSWFHHRPMAGCHTPVTISHIPLGYQQRAAQVEQRSSFQFYFVCRIVTVSALHVGHSSSLFFLFRCSLFVYQLLFTTVWGKFAPLVGDARYVAFVCDWFNILCAILEFYGWLCDKGTFKENVNYI